ncbi:alanyl-tRNA editing protein [Deinococcus radiophilus]|uniref:Serine-tRNA(Ala) deacylase n=1 Tax=Deinococcus radiophilus TaxID=32062 RepID=A0A431VUC6_9DEIO|nr:alanine--tRNA ligase-related protein [Deinococcus radiophilus]RTR26866.1 serine-tRNA(Ala) deacylase [Deinococcus radiophilus]UFA51768.1 alanine--tRNA ligase-related protein [Deinococcus radiophilus]
MTSSALPPTLRLDHHEPLALTFTAQVLAVQEGLVALDRSAFYPQGGGQNADTGWLSAGEQRWAVADTALDKGTGVVWHTLSENDLPAVGTQVTGELDAPRRLRQMARHTGEHLLAQAFYQVNPAFEVAAVGMRGPDCTLDLRGSPNVKDAQAAEALLRELLVAGPLPLHTRLVPHTDLAAYGLRRETTLTGDVRLVMFGDEQAPFDVSACAGCHLPLGNLAAPITVLGMERIKAGLTRVTFRTGPEAAEYLGQVYRDTRALAQSFSTSPEGLTGRVEALRAERSTLAAENTALREALAGALVQASPLREVGKVTLRLLNLPDAALLAPALSDLEMGEVRAAVAGSRCGVASAAEGVNASEVLRSALETCGGRGGGHATLAQGQVERSEDFLDLIARRIGEA